MCSVDPREGGLDVVPVDWVAEALARLAFAPSLQRATYHLSAGEQARTRLAELTRAFDAALGRPHDLTRFVRVPSAQVRSFRAPIAARFGRLDGRRMEQAADEL